jgi:hypothetical protein
MWNLRFRARIGMDIHAHRTGAARPGCHSLPRLQRGLGGVRLGVDVLGQSEGFILTTAFYNVTSLWSDDANWSAIAA